MNNIRVQCSLVLFCFLIICILPSSLLCQLATHSGFSCGFVIVSYVQPLVLVPSLVGRAGEVVVHVRGLNRHVSSKALLVFLPSFLSQVLTAKALAVILFILEIISYQIFSS